MGLRIALYVRVSTAEQATDLQLRELREFVKSRGWELCTVYDDSGKTGTNTARPMFQNLMRDARQRKIDVVICWKLDRLARSLKDLLSTLTEIQELGIAFISLKDSVDATTSSGRLMMHMLGAFAEFEASLIRDRVRAGLQNARAKGKTLGRPKTRDDGLIRLLRAQGTSIRGIARELAVSPASVQRALKLEKQLKS